LSAAVPKLAPMIISRSRPVPRLRMNSSMTSVAALAMPLLSSARTPPLPFRASALRLSGLVMALDDVAGERLPFFAWQERFCTIYFLPGAVFRSQISVAE